MISRFKRKHLDATQQQRTTDQLLSDQVNCEICLETCMPNDAQELSVLLSAIEAELARRKATTQDPSA